MTEDDVRAKVAVVRADALKYAALEPGARAATAALIVLSEGSLINLAKIAAR